MARISEPGSQSIVEAAESYQILEIINRGLAYAIIIAGFLSVVFIFVGGISLFFPVGKKIRLSQR